MKRILTGLVFLCTAIVAHAQESFPINGVRDIRSGLYAFTNATIIQNENTKIEKGVLIIKMGKIVAVGANLIDNVTGSIEAGKDANIIISTGDILDMRGNQLTQIFIQGRTVSLDNKQLQLYERYKHKYGIK